MVAGELEGLERISETLLTENEKLHQHSFLRTQDLRKVVEIISLNLSEEENNMSHRIHLYNEQNNFMTRALNDLRK